MNLFNHWVSNIDYYGGILVNKGLPFNLDNKIWMFGCSHAYGTGLDKGQSAVDVLSNLIGEKVFNFGRPASGPMMVEHLLIPLLKKYTPKAVIIAWPSLLRWQTKEKLVPYPVLWAPFCLEEHDVVDDCLHYGTKSLWPTRWKEYKKMVQSGEIVNINLEVIERVRSSLKNIKTIEFTFVKDELILTNLWAPEVKDLAKDHMHFGPETHKDVAYWIKNQL